MKYRIEYSNGAVTYLNFENKWEVADFLHHEGDHVVSCNRYDEDERRKDVG